MTSKINPPPSYDQINEQRYRRSIERRLARSHKTNERLIRSSENGTKWEIVVGNDGTLSTVQIDA